MIGELRFAPYEVFPKSKKQINSLYAPDGAATTEFRTFRLESMEYSIIINGADQRSLAEMQLNFSNGVSTPMIGSNEANTALYKKVDIDTKKQIRYV